MEAKHAEMMRELRGRISAFDESIDLLNELTPEGGGRRTAPDRGREEELMVFYDELHEREQRRSIEADCQRHLRRENWPEEPTPTAAGTAAATRTRPTDAPTSSQGSKPGAAD